MRISSKERGPIVAPWCLSTVTRSLERGSISKNTMLMSESKLCPDCLEEHADPISNELLGLYRQFKSSKSKEERLELSQRIAEAFLTDHDFTDHAGNEDYHSYFEKFSLAKREYELAAARLSRLAVHITEEYLESNHTTDAEIEAKTRNTTN